MKFNPKYDSKTGEGSGKLFEGAFTSVIESATTFANLDDWRANKPSEVDPYGDGVLMILEIKPLNGKYSNKLFLFGGEPFKFDNGDYAEHSWHRAFRVTGCDLSNPALVPQDLVGKPVTALYYASDRVSEKTGKPYTAVWDVLEAPEQETALENNFRSRVRKSGSLRKKVYPQSQFVTGEDPMEFPPKDVAETKEQQW